LNISDLDHSLTAQAPSARLLENDVLPSENAATHQALIERSEASIP
jgi:hypothetical protein